MKKNFIAAAIVLMAGGFVSCGDVEACYEIQTTYKLAGMELKLPSTTIRTTKNHIKDFENQQKEAAMALGASENTIKVTSTMVPDSNCN